VKRERHRVPHLSRLWQRREQFDMRKIGPQVGLAAPPVDQRTRQIEAGVVRIDERKSCCFVA
jgi:hypothetical protein